MTSDPQEPSLRSELITAAAIARRHYLDNRSKIEIATELGISRFKVARLLELARSEGLVTIEVRDPRGIDGDLSEALRVRLGIERALVVDVDSSPRSQVGALAAQYLQDTVQPGMSIGLAWSRSTQALAEHLGKLAPCTIVQLCGVVAQASGEEHNVELVRRAAHRAGVAAMTFYAPLVVPDAATASTLRRDPGISAALGRCGELSMAVIAVGMWAPSESTVYDALPADQRAEFGERGALAETCGILVDAEGKLLADGLQHRTIAVTADQLRGTDDVVALATDPERVPAVLALARSGLISTLITHRAFAQEILVQPEAAP